MKNLKLLIFVLLTCCVSGFSQDIEQSEGKLININGTELFVKVVGSGEPIIVVHGGPVLDHSYLYSHLEPLSENYKLIFYDQRLSGRSSANVDSSDISLSTFVKDIKELQSHLDLEEAHVLGHSWGGLLAMKYAISYPSYIKSLMLINSMAPTSELWHKEETILARRKTEEDSLARQKIMQSEPFRDNSPEAIEKLLELSFRNQFYNRENAKKLDLFVPNDYMARSRSFSHLMADLSDYDLLQELEKMDLPTLVIYGASEPATNISGPVLDKHIPNSDYTIIKKSGHFPFIEQPLEFRQTVQDFLERIPGKERK